MSIHVEKRQVAFAYCDHCTNNDYQTYNEKTSRHTVILDMIDTLREREWYVSGGVTLCPECKSLEPPEDAA